MSTKQPMSKTLYASTTCVALIITFSIGLKESSAFQSTQQGSILHHVSPRLPSRQRTKNRLHVLLKPEDLKTKDTNLAETNVLTTTALDTLSEIDESCTDQHNTTGFASLLSQLEGKIGKVDDDRIIYPELESGEVSRMFSSLQYRKSDEGSLNAVHATGSVVGATALLSSTVLGGGVLALPAATASVGYLPSVAGLCIGWFYMTLSGLLLAELSINRLGRTGRLEPSLLKLYDDSLGPKLAKLGTGTFYFLYYTVIAAFIAQGGQNLDAFLSSMGFDDFASIQGSGQALLTSICALGFFASSSSIAEKVYQGSALLLIVAFAGIIGLGAESTDFSSLVDLTNQHPELLPNAFPIIFLSLGYQTMVPTIVKQLEGDRKKIVKAIVAGTTIPALTFLAWNTVILGNVQGVDLTGGVDPLALLQNVEVGGESIGVLIGAFSSLAIFTTLIGFTRTLMDGLRDSLALNQGDQQFDLSKAALVGLGLLPPLALATANPDIFDAALNYAGAFGVSTFCLVLPPVMAWRERYGEEQAPLATKPIVPLGKLSLGSMWKAAGTLIVEQGAERLGIFEWISENVLNS